MAPGSLWCQQDDTLGGNRWYAARPMVRFWQTWQPALACARRPKRWEACVAGRPFQWGILSAANIARRRFVPGIQSSAEGQAAAVAARDIDRAREFAAELGIPRAYGSYEELLADPEIDGVYIGLPNLLHAE